MNSRKRAWIICGDWMREHSKRAAQAHRIALRKNVVPKKIWGGRYTSKARYLRVLAKKAIYHQKKALRRSCDACKRVCPLRVPHDISPCNFYSRGKIIDFKIYFEMLELSRSV